MNILKVQVTWNHLLQHPINHFKHSCSQLPTTSDVIRMDQRSSGYGSPSGADSCWAYRGLGMLRDNQKTGNQLWKR